MATGLPFPHGDGPGQIGHQADISKTDTPTSTGGRFVGFAEIGTSAISNRAAWALSTNINYLYEKVVANSLAVNTSVRFTSVGITSYTLNGVVFCGDNTYPGDAEGLRALFSVVDLMGNSLLDTSGNVVGIYSVVGGSNSSVYKQGFITNPKVYFCTYDIYGNVAISPYTIPNSTVLRLIYSVQSSLESLPTDALTRYVSLGIEDAFPLGVVLQDGTRAMTGNLNIGSHNIYNCQVMNSTAVNCTNVTCSDIFGLNTGAILKANNVFTITPTQGTVATLTAKYTVNPAESGIVKDLAKLSLAGGDAYTSRSSITLQGNPKSGTSKTRVLWNVTDTTQTPLGMTLVFDPTNLYFGPYDQTSSNMSLGNQDHPWSTLCANLVNATTAVIIDSLVVNFDHLQVEDKNVEYFYRLPSPQDYHFMQDFGNASLNVITGGGDMYVSAIDDAFYVWTEMNGQQPSQVMATSPVFGRSTLAMINPSLFGSYQASIVGPTIISPNNNFFTLRTSICFGTDIGNKGCLLGFYYDVYTNLHAVEISISSTHIVARTYNRAGAVTNTQSWYGAPPTSQFIDITIAFTPSNVSLYTSHGEYVEFAFVPTQSNPLTPILTATNGPISVDYIELYSEGHLVRPAW